VAESRPYPGQALRQRRGWLFAHRWLMLRRSVQIGTILLFLLGPLAGIWIIKGTLSASLLFDTLPLADPFLLLQSSAAGHLPHLTALMGAAIILALYLLLGGRSYCSWVCPVNMVSDAASALHERLGLRQVARFPRYSRYLILLALLLVALMSGVMAWEMINPVTLIHRGLVFGLGAAVWLIVALFLFELFVTRRGWCSHLCPMGAFWAVIGRVSLLRIAAKDRQRCDDCMDCYNICPEPQVIKPALKPKDPAATPIIVAGACTQCARCIEVCDKEVFSFSHRLASLPSSHSQSKQVS
jgi:ferredoxin-type protein NapH